LGNLARDVAAWDVRKWNRNAWNAGANPEVEMVHGASPDADEDFVRADFWVRGVLILENFWAAVLVEDYGLQRTLSILSR